MCQKRSKWAACQGLRSRQAKKQQRSSSFNNPVDQCSRFNRIEDLAVRFTYDDLMHWSFGDNGVYQFWISPADLAQQNWAAAKMTFECH
jgi:hypothetical protein